MYYDTYQVIPAAIIVGIVGGLIGAFFIAVNFKMNAWRKPILVKEWMKPIETLLWSFITSTCLILVPYAVYKANAIGGTSTICNKYPTDLDI